MEVSANRKVTERLLFRLLPIQILLAAIGAVNGIVTGLFAGNSVGELALSSVGLYAPIAMLSGALSTILVGGSMILCGQYLGREENEKMQGVFVLDILLTALAAVLFVVFHLLSALFTDGSFLCKDPALWPLFRQYLLGQSIGILPFFLGNQLAAFLSLENQVKRTTFASLVYILANILFDFLFLKVLHWEAFGLALAASLGLWVFCLLQAQYFFTEKAVFRFRKGVSEKGEGLTILKIGLPGAMSYLYQSLRGMIVNDLLLQYVGNAGLSAFAASNSLMSLFWAVPEGMLAVSRMLMGVSIGEEDRQTLTDIMKTMFYRFLPLMSLISLCIIGLAVPFTNLYFHEPSEAVFGMCVSAFRILPLCMPLSVICMHFSCYWQSSKRPLPVHILAALDGVVSVAAFSFLLIPTLGARAVYIANVLNGVVTTLFILGYAAVKQKHLPRSIEELMVIPEGFGVSEEERMDLSLHSREEVVNISEKIRDFCRQRGLDEKRSYYASLFLEEMAGNVVEHGFHKDKKPHSVDIRVIHKNEKVILRIRDDCVPFDPAERRAIRDLQDITRNIGIRMVYRIAEEITYRNILGLNVLTITI